MKDGVGGCVRFARRRSYVSRALKYTSRAKKIGLNIQILYLILQKKKTFSINYFYL